MTDSLQRATEALALELDRARDGNTVDIHHALSPTGVFGQRLTTALAVYAQLAECRRALELAVAALARPLRRAGAAELLATQLETHASAFAGRSNMPGLAAFLQRASVEVGAAADRAPSDALVTYLELLSDFVFALRFLLSAEIPWHELAVAFEGARALNAELAVHARLTTSLAH